jgi:Ca-activated chloride channel family protein
MSHFARLLFTATFVVICFSGLAAHQGASSTATLAGTVVDKDGALVPGATVSVTKVDTGEKLPVLLTTRAGQYSFAGLAPGKYKLTISLQGFKTIVVDVTLTAASINNLGPLRLEVGAVTEVVNVVAGTDLIRTDTPTVSQSVNTNFIQWLPRSDRAAGGGSAAPPAGLAGMGGGGGRGGGTAYGQMGQMIVLPRPYANNETYSQFQPNRFHATTEQPLSTFGADVDTASYSNIRRFLTQGQLPPPDAVRIEELVNYFRFGYATPRDGQPMALTTEIGECPWNTNHKLVLIGSRAAAPAKREITGRNIVLLIDVSGSMAPADRLPLLKTAFALFVDTLRPTDTLAIVTYAGSSGVALEPTPARQRGVIQDAIASLGAGGSTNGAQGLVTAYGIARRAFVKGGVNRVILATDGDFNVGVTSQNDLLQLIERERASGVFLSVLGVGSGNLKDATMEMLADKGNGNYAYLDSLQEARRVLVKEGDATLETVAKDVKFQVEFNPAVVAEWKLLGYENRTLAARDFNDDRKDAGEIGAGHTVTVLYELIPVGAEDAVAQRNSRPEIDPLRYQPAPSPAPRPLSPRPPQGAMTGEWLTVKARYKMPDSDTSALITRPVRVGGTPQHLALAAAIAEFGQILRDDPRDLERWDSLASWLERLAVPADLATDVDGLKDLVATARGIVRGTGLFSTGFHR